MRHSKDHDLFTLDKLDDLFTLILGLTLFNQVNLILHDEDVLKFHDLYRGQMFRRLRLWTRLVTGCIYEQGSTVITDVYGYLE